MGLLDKAKKMAEQAQAKLDEAQKQFNPGERSAEPSGAVVQYDEHGRPIPQESPESATPPHGDPLAEQAPPPPPPPPAPEAVTPGASPTAHGDPLTGETATADQPPQPPAQPTADQP